MRTVLSCAAGLMLGLTILAARDLTRTDDWSLSIERLPSPAGANSASPQLTTSEHGASLSWLEKAGARTTLKFAERTASGWSEPRAIVSGDDFFANWADVPSVVRLADRMLVAHWLQKSGSGTYAYDVRLARSTDDGRTWSPSFTPHHDGTQTEHGFASLFQAPGAGLGLVWLDGRAMKPSHDHGGEGTGDMSLRSATYDRAGRQIAEHAVDLRVCECCPTAAAVTADGPIVAFRNRSADEIRDIYVSRFAAGKWTEPKAVHDDGWRINGCPVQGPALSARGRDVVAAWFTGRDDIGRALVAFSQDAGATFASPIRVDEASALGRVDVELLADGSAVVSWIERADGRAWFAARRVKRDGTRSAALTLADLAANRTSGYPRLARHGGELLFAWTASESGTTRVHTAAAPLTPPATQR